MANEAAGHRIKIRVDLELYGRHLNPRNKPEAFLFAYEVANIVAEYTGDTERKFGMRLEEGVLIVYVSVFVEYDLDRLRRVFWGIILDATLANMTDAFRLTGLCTYDRGFNVSEIVGLSNHPGIKRSIAWSYLAADSMTKRLLLAS